MVAAQAVPVFPGRGKVSAARSAVYGGERGRSGAHSRDVWDRLREQLCRQASGLEREAGSREGLLATVEIEFLARLSKHVCECGVVGCADWQAWGVGQVRGLAQVWRALGGEWQTVPPGYARALAAVVRQG